MYLKTSTEELIEAVLRAGGAIEPHLLTESALSALVLVPRLRRISCAACGLVLIADHARKRCLDCARARENRAQWQREKARRRKP